jgi:uncharacterized protein (TIGR00730 family)
MTKDEIEKNIDEQVHAASKELRAGFEFMERYPKRVTIFGSAQAMPESVHFKAAVELAGRIVRETGYTVVTGGGPGIMCAANKGAREARGKTIGLAIGLPREQRINEYVDDVISFEHFFVRKTMLTFAAEVFVFFPGGFGTFDELFDVLDLISTRKIPRVPVILVGADFWHPLSNFIKTQMYENHAAIDKGDMQIYHVTDDLDTVINMIKKAPLEPWWKDAD